MPVAESIRGLMEDLKAMARYVYAIATMDTKGEEILFVAACLRTAGIEVRVVDVGTHHPPTHVPDISRDEVLGGLALPDTADRGVAVTAMGEALGRFLQRQANDDTVAGVLGIGGSGGTALITAAMRQLDIGLPKLMVSTVPSGNTATYVDSSDIAMLYSVVDVAGLNRVSCRVLANAAHAMAGMVSHPVQAFDARPAIGITMFGVTTPCVTTLRQLLEQSGYECFVFHATGTGGRAMEKLVDAGFLQGIIDVTTTEVADEVVGGVFPAGVDRFAATLARQVPFVLSLGALDMVNFGARDTVPERFQRRLLHEHNAQVTLMRTNPEENRAFARWIAHRLNRSQGPWTVVIPEGGLSSLDDPGQVFHDPEADAALFEELANSLHQDEYHRLVRLPMHINQPEFAAELASQFEQLSRVGKGDE
jgi:uncharacterized protein (UPF0261 family)